MNVKKLVNWLTGVCAIMRFKRKLRRYNGAFGPVAAGMIGTLLTVSVFSLSYIAYSNVVGNVSVELDLTPYQHWALGENGDPPDDPSLTGARGSKLTPANPKAAMFGNPTPPDGAENQPQSFIWSISITQQFGDMFNWWINCSNGNSSKGINDVGGIKTLSISGLEYSTTYVVIVTAKTVGILNTTHTASFTFSTASNWPVEISDPSPADGAIDQPLEFCWTIGFSDPEGDPIDWSIECSNGYIESGTLDLPPGVHACPLFCLEDLDYSTEYTIDVTVIDSGSGIEQTASYTFTTIGNQPVEFGEPNPEDGATDQPLEVIWSISIANPECDPMDCWINCSNGQQNSVTGILCATAMLALSDLDYSTEYTVTVEAIDSGCGIKTTASYTFTTMSNPDSPAPPPGGPPGGPGHIGDASPLL